MDKKIIVFTTAYNAAGTLARCVDSVVNQTHADWVYYLLDNGSKDGTRAIVEQYAANHPNIRPVFHAKNQKGPLRMLLQTILQENPDDAYLTALDADDWLDPDCFEKALAFADSHELDIAVFGSRFILPDGQVEEDARKVDEALIFNDEEMPIYFTVIHKFIRTVWGKLFSIGLMRQCDYSDATIAYGGDTAFCLDTLLEAKKLGFMPDVLHNYVASMRSVSHKFDPQRTLDDFALYHKGMRFLAHYGSVSQSNGQFLQAVLLHAVKDTLRVIISAQIPPAQQLDAIGTLLSHPNADILFAITPSEFSEGYLVADLAAQILNFMLDKKVQKACRVNLDRLGQLLLRTNPRLSALPLENHLKLYVQTLPDMLEPLMRGHYKEALGMMEAYFAAHHWDSPPLAQMALALFSIANRTNLETYQLLCALHKKPNIASQVDLDAHMLDLAKQEPLLVSAAQADILWQYPAIIALILDQKQEQAYEALLDVYQAQAPISEDFLLLGQNLSAWVENAQAYVLFRKLHIAFLIDSGRMAQANEQLQDLSEILPADDPELAELQKGIILP